jgi:putative inorganic carbon (HCO3(-)) transporter
MLNRIRAYLPPSLQNTPEITAFLGLAGCVSLVLVSIAISQILLAPALVASFWIISSNKKLYSSMRWILLPLILYCIWSVLTALMAPDMPLAITVIKKFYLFLLIPLVPIIARGQNRLLWIYRAIFAVALFSALVGIGQYLTITDAQRNDLLNRICGFMSHWMTYTGLLMLALLLLIAYGVRTNWRRYFLWVPVAALIALAIIFSQTRNTALGVYVGVFVILVLAIFLEKQRRFIVFIICFILFSAVLYFAAPASVQQRFRSGLNPHDDTARGRMEMVETSIRMIRANPWFGVGPKNVKHEALKYRNQNEFPDWMYQHMHNNFLQIAAERGIPGLAIWLWLVIRIAWDSLCTYRFARSPSFPYGEECRREATLASSAALGCWVALMIAGMFEFNFGDSEVLTLFLFIMSAPYVYSPNTTKAMGPFPLLSGISNNSGPDA